VGQHMDAVDLGVHGLAIRAATAASHSTCSTQSSRPDPFCANVTLMLHTPALNNKCGPYTLDYKHPNTDTDIRPRV